MKPEATNHANRVRNAILAAIPSPATQTTETPSFDCRLPQADPLPAKLGLAAYRASRSSH